MKPNPKTMDASKRLVNFYLDEADAYKLDILCDEKGITRTQFFAGVVAELTVDIDLTDEDNLAINAAIQARIDRGYPTRYKSPKRYKRT